MKARAPNLPIPPREYDKLYFDRLTRDLTLFFEQLTTTGALRGTTLTLVGLVGANTLSGPISAGGVTIPLASADAFPTSGIGLIMSEKFSWSGKAGNSLTGVVRGIEGTSAAGYVAGAVVVSSAVPGTVYANPGDNVLKVVV